VTGWVQNKAVRLWPFFYFQLSEIFTYLERPLPPEYYPRNLTITSTSLIDMRVLLISENHHSKSNNYIISCRYVGVRCVSFKKMCIVQKDVFSSQNYYPQTQQLHLHLFLVCSFMYVGVYRTKRCILQSKLLPQDTTITPSSVLGVFVYVCWCVSYKKMYSPVKVNTQKHNNYTFICSWCVRVVPFKKTYSPLHSDLSIVYMCVYACVCVGMCMWACVMQAVSAAVGGVVALQSAGKIYHKSNILKTQ